MTEPAVLGERYELGEVLGRGGMAEVRAGRDTRLGRAVAVKMLRPDLARDPSFQARFRREAQSAAALNHPSIVAVYDTGEDHTNGASVPFIVMEYVEGTTLRELLNSGRRLLPERALEIIAGVLEALDYSHRNGIVHRDIKPANVMLTPGGSVKVMDFGIARAVADASATMTQTSAVIGTAQYLSPEQARGESVDMRTDLYSTGCVLYELLTGRPPFVGDSPVSVAYQHVREDPVPPSSIDPEIPPAVDAIVLKSLAKNRDNRYQTAAEMRSDIERHLAGRPVQAPPILAAPVLGEATRTMGATAAGGPAPQQFGGPPPREPERGDNRVLMWTLLAVLAVLLVAGLIFALTQLAGGGGGDQPKQVQVPGVIGEQINVATAELEKLEFKVNATGVQRPDQTPGEVIAQDPRANEYVDPGSTITLTYVEEPNKVRVPSVEGRTEADAIRLLEQAQLKWADSTQENSAQPAGTVLRSDPPQGQSVDAGTEVTLVVASGKNEVPRVTGRSEEQARAALGDAGFTNIVIEEITTTDQNSDGVVQRQSPSSGSEQDLGAKITLTVARYEVPPTTAPPTNSPTTSPTIPPVTPPPGG